MYQSLIFSHFCTLWNEPKCKKRHTTLTAALSPLPSLLKAHTQPSSMQQGTGTCALHSFLTQPSCVDPPLLTWVAPVCSWGIVQNEYLGEVWRHQGQVFGVAIQVHCAVLAEEALCNHLLSSVQPGHNSSAIHLLHKDKDINVITTEGSIYVCTKTMHWYNHLSTTKVFVQHKTESQR